MINAPGVGYMRVWLTDEQLTQVKCAKQVTIVADDVVIAIDAFALDENGQLDIGAMQAHTHEGK